jgi:phosphoribosyl-ATP pyrophosphohydrolase
MPESSILTALEAVILERKANPPAKPSYVVKLMAGGVPAIGAKVIEEAAEVVEAADEPGAEGRAHLVREAADLIFHTLVMLGHRGVALAEVEAELGRRFGIGGIEEKQARGGGVATPHPNPLPQGERESD